MTGSWPSRLLLLPLLLIAGAVLLSACNAYRNPCDNRPTYESRQACNNALIDFDRQLRSNRSYRTL